MRGRSEGEADRHLAPPCHFPTWSDLTSRPSEDTSGQYRGCFPASFSLPLFEKSDLFLERIPDCPEKEQSGPSFHSGCFFIAAEEK